MRTHEEQKSANVSSANCSVADSTRNRGEGGGQHFETVLADVSSQFVLFYFDHFQGLVLVYGWIS